MTPLNKDAAGKAWCGPTALCVITGQPLTKVRDALKDIKDSRRAIKGVRREHMVRALHRLGFRATKTHHFADGSSPTLAGFLRSRPKELMNVHLLIEVARHYVTVKGRKFADTFTSGQPVFIGKAPGRRKRVKAVWVVEKYL